MKTPAISKELDFVARHAAVAGDVYDGTLKVDTTVRALTVVVCDKADSDAERLARQLSEGLSRALHGIIRIDWKKFNVEIWEIKGAVFGGARGRKGKKIGEIGLVVSWYTNETPRLIGWVWSKGGVQPTKFDRRDAIPRPGISSIFPLAHPRDNDEPFNDCRSATPFSDDNPCFLLEYLRQFDPM
jgi:hypothetical protein